MKFMQKIQIWQGDTRCSCDRRSCQLRRPISFIQLPWSPNTSTWQACVLLYQVHTDFSHGFTHPWLHLTPQIYAVVSYLLIHSLPWQQPCLRLVHVDGKVSHTWWVDGGGKDVILCVLSSQEFPALHLLKSLFNSSVIYNWVLNHSLSVEAVKISHWVTKYISRDND